ncbi:hypothetical protein [Pandoraea terrae]|nr:hypothetical protein [Pandoraea terrae]
MKKRILETYRGAQIEAWPIHRGVGYEAWVRFRHPKLGHLVHKRVVGPTAGAFDSLESLTSHCRARIGELVSWGEILE